MLLTKSRPNTSVRKSTALSLGKSLSGLLTYVSKPPIFSTFPEPDASGSVLYRNRVAAQLTDWGSFVGDPADTVGAETHDSVLVVERLELACHGDMVWKAFI